MIQSVYIEKDDENEAPPSRVLKVSFFKGGNDAAGEFMPPVVFLAIGDYDEKTYSDSFVADEDSTFAVTLEDLLLGLGAVGAIAEVQPKVRLNAA